jgi:hypothetical protein
VNLPGDTGSSPETLLGVFFFQDLPDRVLVIGPEGGLVEEFGENTCLRTKYGITVCTATSARRATASTVIPA